MVLMQALPPAVPFLPVPGVTPYTSSITLPSTTVPVSGAATTAVSAEVSSAHSAERKAGKEELPLWVETKTAEGKVSLMSSSSSDDK